MTRSGFRFAAIALFMGLGAAVPLHAATGKLTTKDVVDALRKADAANPANFSGQDLSNLDLSGIDFKQADLQGANLFGADLTEANLSRSKLSGANLDRSTIIRTNFAQADMTKVTMVLPAAFTSFDAKPNEAPIFTGTDMRGAKIIAKLSWADMRGANMAGTAFNLGEHFKATQGAHTVYSDLTGCKMNGANLSGAHIAGTLLSMADLSGANLANADFEHSDLSGANLSGANVAGANFTNADLGQADTKTMKGGEKAVGLR